MRTIPKLPVLMVVLITAAALMCTACSACSIRNYYIEESQVNFREYSKRLADIANGYGFQLIQTESSYIDDPEDKSIIEEFAITVDENARIEILFSNMPGRHKKGKELFSVSYFKNQQASDFEVDLFAALVDSLSSRTISFDQCAEFLNAPEEEYATPAHRKLNGEKIVKHLNLDFFENWCLWYIRKADDSEELSFNGVIG